MPSLYARACAHLNPSASLALAFQPDPEDLIVWPEGTSCRRDELQQMGHMSDDFEVVPFGSSKFIALTADRLYFEMELVYLAQSYTRLAPTFLLAKLDIPTIERILQLRHQAISEDLSSIAVPHKLKLTFKLEDEPEGVERVVVGIPLVQYMDAIGAKGDDLDTSDDGTLVVTKNAFWFAGTWSSDEGNRDVYSDPTPITHEFFTAAVGMAEITTEVLVEFLLNEDARRQTKPVAEAAALATAQTECGQRCGQCNAVTEREPGMGKKTCEWCAMPVFLRQ